MTAQYFTVLTNYGTQAFAKALATNLCTLQVISLP